MANGKMRKMPQRLGSQGKPAGMTGTAFALTRGRGKKKGLRRRLDATGQMAPGEPTNQGVANAEVTGVSKIGPRGAPTNQKPALSTATAEMAKKKRRARMVGY